MFHQLSLVLAIFDVIACATTIREKNGDDAACKAQEYLLQFGLLGKAATTLTICHVSMRTMRDMEVLGTTYVFSHLSAVMLGVLGCIGVSIYFDTGFLWCGGNEFKAFYLSSSVRELVYIAAFLLPIFACVVINCYCYVSISSEIRGRVGRNASSESEVTAQRLTEEAKLYRVIKNILFYPIFLAVCFTPEVVAITHSLATGHFNIILYQLATVFLGLNGTFMAINYFRQQKMHPNLEKITFGVQTHVFFVGRNISSLLRWSDVATESTRSVQNPLSNSSSAGTGGVGGSESGGVALTDSSVYESTASGLGRGSDVPWEEEEDRGSEGSDSRASDLNFTVFFK